MYYGAPFSTGVAAAGARYRNVDVSARVESASPHRLVAILFEELLKSVDVLTATVKRGDRSGRADRLSRCLSILSTLESSLDFDGGGEIATSLLQVYRAARRMIIDGARDSDVGPLQSARVVLGEIASAWEQIG